MNVIWTPLTEEELAALKEGDPIVTHTGSKGAFQWYPSQRLKPEVTTFREAKYVEKSKRRSVLVLKEGTDRTIWVAGTEVGRYEDRT